MTVLASADIGNGGSSGSGARLLVPKMTAAQHIRAHIQRGIAIRRQRIRYIEDLEDVRALKGEWVNSYTDTLKQLFSTSSIADECNDWVGKVYPEFADVTLFVEQFYEEMDYRVRKLRGVLKKLDDMGDFVPRTINAPMASPGAQEMGGGMGSGGMSSGGMSSGGISSGMGSGGMGSSGGLGASGMSGGMSASGMSATPMGMVSPGMMSSPQSQPAPMQPQYPISQPTSISAPVMTSAATVPTPSYPAPKPHVGVTSASQATAPAPVAAPPPAAALPPPPVTPDAPPLNNGIFVVHGDMRTASNTVLSFMEDLGIRLQSMPAAPEKGKGLVESLEKNPDASFAVMLLPHDDVVALRGNASDAAANVRTGIVFQLGYFVGRLGLKRVCVLYTGGNETFVSDHGIQFLPMDSGNGWQLLLARHLKRAGIEIDLNKLF
jgi:predicted nucleotide-binding protein